MLYYMARFAIMSQSEDEASARILAAGWGAAFYPKDVFRFLPPLGEETEKEKREEPNSEDRHDIERQ